AGLDLGGDRPPAVAIAEEHDEVQRRRDPAAAADLFEADVHRAAIARRRVAHAPAQVDGLEASAALAAQCFEPRKHARLQHGPLADHVAEGGADEDAKDLL